jgi:hypothetical protein
MGEVMTGAVIDISGWKWLSHNGGLMDRNDPGRSEALARAHEMRAMRGEGLPDELIAKLFCYEVESVGKIIAWHERLYSQMPVYDGDTAAWREFKGRYLRGRL